VDSTRAYEAGLRILARRELPAAGVRARLEDRGFPPEEVEAAIARLTESGALDDRRVARAYARTAATVKGRGRLRVVRELQQMGISAAIAAEALGDVFGELDERALITRALDRKLRGRTALAGPQEQARLYQFLMRQGFSPAGVAAALGRLRGARRIDQE
jgi:regulatory protein